MIKFWIQWATHNSWNICIWLIGTSFIKPDLSVSRPRPVQPLRLPPLPWRPHAASAFGTDDWYDDHKVLLHRHDIPRGRCQGCPRSMEAAKSSRSSGMSRFGFGDLTAPGELENSGHRLKLKFDFWKKMCDLNCWKMIIIFWQPSSSSSGMSHFGFED